MTRQEIEEKSRELAQRDYSIINQQSLENCLDSSSLQISVPEGGYYYFRIDGIGAIDDASRSESSQGDYILQLIISMSSLKMPFSLVLKGSGIGDCEVYVGTSSQYNRQLLSLLRANIPQVVIHKKTKWSSDNRDYSLYDYADIFQAQDNIHAYSGFVKGSPFTGNDDAIQRTCADAIIRGMGQRPWSLTLFCDAIPKAETLARYNTWSVEATTCSELQEIVFSESTNAENISYHKAYQQSENYLNKIHLFRESAARALSSGEWLTTVLCSANTKEDFDVLSGIISGSFGERKRNLEPVHVIRIDRPFPVLEGTVGNLHYDYHPRLPYPIYSNILCSEMLAEYCRLPSEDTYGFSVAPLVRFDIDRKREGDICFGKIVNNYQTLDASYSLSSSDLTRHCLVVGLTGSGKTNTIQAMLCETARNNPDLPFLVIEPAKKEYWELYKFGFTDLQLYTIGSTDPSSHPYCINPFERMEGVSLQTHLDYLFACFKASFIMYTPMPYVLERALYAVYEDYGWDVCKDTNKFGVDNYPTIEDLYLKIPDVVVEMGYDQKMRDDLIGSLQARINSLRLGTKGITLNVKKSFPLNHILNGHVVIELEDIGDDDVKAFIISLLLVQLSEYRRNQPDSKQKLRHLMLIEEAHRLLKNVASGSGESADPRGNAVEMFCNLLAELRSKGQGFIVADQIPSKLAPDLIKNTNAKIAHRIVSADDRELISGAMHMTEAQTEHLSCLEQGTAAMYSEGDIRPKLVRPVYAGQYEDPQLHGLTRQNILNMVSPSVIKLQDSLDYSCQTGACVVCKRCLPYCRRSPQNLWAILNNAEFDRFAQKTDPQITKTLQAQNIYNGICDFIQEQALQSGLPHKQLCCCLLSLLLQKWHLTDTEEQRLINSFFTLREMRIKQK